MNVIGIALDELYRIFNILNKDKFDENLPEPVITIQKTKGTTLGHFTVDKVWKDKKVLETNESATEEPEAYYEINIDPRWFGNRSAEEIVETLLHEMVHYCNKVNEIKDCSGNVHNKKFKTLAEAVGLVVEKGKSVGWGYTSLSDELKEYIQTNIKPDETHLNILELELPLSLKLSERKLYSNIPVLNVSKLQKERKILLSNVATVMLLWKWKMQKMKMKAITVKVIR